MMSVFVYCYLTQVVFRSADSMERVMEYIHMMPMKDRMTLYELLNAEILGNVTAGLSSFNYSSI